MDLNKAALCGRLQQTGPGWAPGTPREGWGEAQAGGGAALESMVCAREKEACVTGSLSAHPATRGAAPRDPSTWQKAQQTALPLLTHGQPTILSIASKGSCITTWAVHHSWH